MTGRVLPLPGQSAGHGDPEVPTASGSKRRALDRPSTALLTIQDVADYTKVSYWTARGWIESGKLQVLRLPGRLIRIRAAALEAFLDRECR